MEVVKLGEETKKKKKNIKINHMFIWRYLLPWLLWYDLIVEWTTHNTQMVMHHDWTTYTGKNNEAIEFNSYRETLYDIIKIVIS